MACGDDRGASTRSRRYGRGIRAEQRLEAQGAFLRQSDQRPRRVQPLPDARLAQPVPAVRRDGEAGSRHATAGRRLRDGAVQQIYVDHVGPYVGVDLSYNVLRLADRKFSQCTQVSFAQADACRLPFPDRSFDIVAFSSVLHHIPSYVTALREAARVLRPTGHVFAFDPNLLHPAMALFRHPSSPFYLAEGVSPNERPLVPARFAGHSTRPASSSWSSGANPTYRTGMWPQGSSTLACRCTISATVCSS